MIISVHLPDIATASQPNPLPPTLAQIGSSELVLIELQGELDVEGNKHGQTVGTLTVDNGGKAKPTLRIGYHLLEGKVVSLSKPLAVLQRNIPHTTQADDSTVRSTSKYPPSYTVRSVVRKKLVFSKRPTPMVGVVNVGGASEKPPSSVGLVNDT
ncbi:hypothetical protein BV25DRAFT_1819607 [Artomyces pyxidatus]|uniref:Uncharacterized protein n=1 Tax=Artomyces pyxidatus TaxID=48021 RepID=A0ACB8TFU7_9AGAM|nr:hypothetical protein BV25DRAFT_1819607 [Artomyces pyxidatus]